jgi:hypothetical protein
MREDFLVPISNEGKRVLDLIKTDRQQATDIMESLSGAEQISLVSHHALNDPKGAQELLFLLADEKSKDIVDGLGERTLFRIMKAQSSTHIGLLSIVQPGRIQAILDLDPELFSARGATDPQSAYHWIISFLEEEDVVFAKLLKNLDIRMVASAFQDKIVRPWARTSDRPKEEEEAPFPADFLVKLDRMELKPDDLDVTDEETLDILTKIHLADETYFNELVSLMLREDDLKTRTAEEAFDRIHQQVGDLSGVTEEADDMFVPLDD